MKIMEKLIKAAKDIETKVSGVTLECAYRHALTLDVGSFKISGQSLDKTPKLMMKCLVNNGVELDEEDQQLFKDQWNDVCEKIVSNGYNGDEVSQFFVNFGVHIEEKYGIKVVDSNL